MMVDEALPYILDHHQIKIHQMPNFPAVHAPIGKNQGCSKVVTMLLQPVKVVDSFPQPCPYIVLKITTLFLHDFSL